MMPVAQTIQKVTSLELSKALKGAGAKQESEEYWFPNCIIPFPREFMLRQSRELSETSIRKFCYAAFDCPDLLEELPSYVSDGIKEYCLTLEKLSDEYHAMYDGYHHGPCGSAAVEVLGRLLLWGLENGHVEKSKGGS